MLTYASTNATNCTLGVTPTLWSGDNPMPVDCNGGYTATVPANPHGGSWTFTFTAGRVGGGQTVTAMQALAQSAATPPSVPPGATYTKNWAGYVVPSSAVVTDIQGEWTVPSLNCSNTPNAGASEWAGIGGASGSGDSLLQTGVETNCVNGIQQNVAWYELFPSDPNHQIDFDAFPVSAGDTVQAEVYQWANSSTWETCLDDLTTGVTGLMVTGEGWGITTGGCTGAFQYQGTTPSLTYTGGYSAEWIVEDPTSGITQTNMPFADFGSVTFTNLETSLGLWYLVSADATVLVINDILTAVPSMPGSDDFSVSYTG